MKDFNIAKYLKENKLGSYGILGGYVDLHSLKEDNQEVPYKGTDPRLDGDGYELDPNMDVSMNELEKPNQIYTNDWMTPENVDEKKVGSWTAYIEDIHNNVIYWVNDKINTEDVVVYATPGWEDSDGIACEVTLNHGATSLDQETIGQNSYPDFESYAEDMAPYLAMVEKKYYQGEYDEYLDEAVENGDDDEYGPESVSIEDDDYDKDNDELVSEEEEDEEGEESFYAGSIFDDGGDIVEQGIIELLKNHSREDIEGFVAEVLDTHLDAKAQGKQF